MVSMHTDQEPGPNALAVEQTIKTLTDEGTITEGDEALVETLRSMAGVLDKQNTNSQFWHVYSTILRELRDKRANKSESLDDYFAQITG
jgi:hypothetical protein